MHAQPPRRLDEVFIQVPGPFGRCCVVETGPPALAAIAVERELRDRQHRASGIQQAAIHLARIVIEDAQVYDDLQ